MSKLTILGIALAAAVGIAHAIVALAKDRAVDNPYFPRDWTW